MPPANSGLLPILRWEIACVSCQWQVTVQAPVPYIRLHSGQEVEAQPQDYEQIAGFWEDYICPEHFAIARRAMVVDEIGVDLQTAYYHYVNGIGSTTPVPQCPICQHRMHGGQVLSDLPFYLGTQIELQNWVIQKISELQRLAYSENHAVDKGEQIPDKSLQLLTAELETITQFYEALCRQFDLKPTPFGLIDPLPRSLIQWHNVLKETLEAAQYRLDQLFAREQDERRKSPSLCPHCEKCTVYLRYATAL
jgi:hypothetical protein